MSFADDLRAFRSKVHQRERDIFVGSVGAVHGSVTTGSAVTSAPGQPVDTSNLLNSWQETYPEQWVGQTATNVEYAVSIEEGQQAPYTTAAGTSVTPKPIVFKSAVGGAHSVKMTRAGWNPLVRSVVREVVR